MIYLQPNTAAQTLYLTLNEGRTYFTTAFTNYLLVLTREENSTTGFDLAQVVVVVYENTRTTKITVTTVGITSPGKYRYDVYGQNSANNTDPEDASVVGLVERGLCEIADLTVYFDSPNITIPNDVISDSN
jgi:hypothetical protein